MRSRDNIGSYPDSPSTYFYLPTGEDLAEVGGFAITSLGGPIHIDVDGLEPSTPYKLVVFGYDSGGRTDQQVTISGDPSSDPVQFIQHQGGQGNWRVLLSNDVVARDRDELFEHASVVSSSAAGQIDIDVTTLVPSVSSFVAGFALAPARLKTPEVLVDDAGGLFHLEEGGAARTFSVSLNQRPHQTVVVDVELPAGDEIAATVDRLTFTPDDWDVPQIVEVEAVDDFRHEQPVRDKLIVRVRSDLSSDEFGSAPLHAVAVEALDNDTPALLLASYLPPSVREGEGFPVRLQLATEPDGVVSVVSGFNQHLTPDIDRLLFDATNWNQPQTLYYSTDDNDVINGAFTGLFHFVVSPEQTSDAAYRALIPELFETDIVDDEGETDGDGVSDAIESAAAPGGDGNGDGIADAEQAWVSSSLDVHQRGFTVALGDAAAELIYLAADAAGADAPGVDDVSAGVVRLHFQATSSELQSFDIRFHEFAPNSLFALSPQDGLWHPALWNGDEGGRLHGNGALIQVADNGAFDLDPAIGRIDLALGPWRRTTPWQNSLEPLDVDNNGAIQPIDALYVINRLNKFGAVDLAAVPSPAMTIPGFVDVDGNNILAPIDALRIINRLSQTLGGAGEFQNPPSANPLSHDLALAAFLAASDEEDDNRGDSPLEELPVPPAGL